MADKSGNQGSRIGDRMYIVLMAGGVGSRFWPRSRKELPKQMLNLLGEQSMLQMTYERIKPLVNPEKILVITNTELSALVAEQLPDLPEQNIIAEPFGRNTAPCIGLAAAIIQSRSAKDEVMVTLPADHLIIDDEKFRQTIRAAAEYARDYGITPYDGIHIALAIEHNVRDIISADKGLDKVELIRRVDPLSFQV